MTIWDLHCHFARLVPGSPVKSLERLIEIGNRLGIEKFCVYMGSNWEYDPSPENLRNQNDEVLEAIGAFPGQAFGFVYLNPKDVEASLDELNRCVADGPMVGIKLWVAQRCNHRNLDPIVERAVELDVGIFQHTWLKAGGNLPGESTPADLAELADRHPDARLICGHTGGDFELGIRAVKHSPNVHIGIAGSDPTAGFTEMAVRELGADRVIWGSDASGRSFASQLGKVVGAQVDEAAQEKILHTNLRQWLAPALKAKGRDI